jgi:hypothetical protein
MLLCSVQFFQIRLTRAKTPSMARINNAPAELFFYPKITQHTFLCNFQRGFLLKVCEISEKSTKK